MNAMQRFNRTARVQKTRVANAKIQERKQATAPKPLPVRPLMRRHIAAFKAAAHHRVLDMSRPSSINANVTPRRLSRVRKITR